MHPELHLRLHQDRQVAALRAADQQRSLSQRPRPPSRMREALAERLRRLADALEQERHQERVA